MREQAVAERRALLRLGHEHVADPAGWVPALLQSDLPQIAADGGLRHVAARPRRASTNRRWLAMGCSLSTLRMICCRCRLFISLRRVPARTP